MHMARGHQPQNVAGAAACSSGELLPPALAHRRQKVSMQGWCCALTHALQTTPASVTASSSYATFMMAAVDRALSTS